MGRRDAQTGDLFAPPPVIAERCAEVAVPVPIDKAFTYLVPDDLPHDVTAGARVLVPFAGRRLMGLVLDVRPRGEQDGTRLKPILGVVDPAPVLPLELLSFLREVARYYLAPIGEVMALALPAVERKAIRRLRAEGVEPATAAKVAPEHVTRFVRKTATMPLIVPKKLGPAARALLERLERDGEVPLRALTEEWPSASTIVRKLATQQLVEIEERSVEAPAFAEDQARDVAPTLNAEQQVAAQALVAAVDAAADDESTPPLPFLLHGVTGSGKTEVYLRAIAATLARGRGAMVLVPEIALTPQLVARFRARFGDEVAVVHSALDPGSRHAMWRKLHAGQLRVAIGARSALFAPVPRLGLIVVDEEHDASFKQEEGVRYHARDCAILRAHRASAVCVVGSATPSLEVLELCRRGKMTRLRMKERATPHPLPSIEIVDLRYVGAGPSGSKLLSLPLHRALEATLAAKEQAILFLNRRGFAPAVICEACGELRRCPDCDVAFTMHRKSGLRPLRGGEIVSVAPGMRCHYCDRVEPLPDRCPKCQHAPLSLEGIGTEQLEETLARAFPGARVARLDRDVASGHKVEDILRRVRAREVDILVGTQMVTKGHDLPFVTLVGVVNADSALSMPDFRAAERTFQLLVQVAGRAGRGDARGTVYIQTRTPEHWAIACAAHHDVEGFVERELIDREELGYPPFSRLVLVRIDAPDEARAVAAAQQLANVALDQDEVKGARVEVRGPTPAPVPRVRGRFRWRILLRGSRKEVRAVAQAIKLAADGLHKNDVRILVDVDPLSMM